MMEIKDVLDALADYQQGCSFDQFWTEMYPDVEDDHYVEQKYKQMQAGCLYCSLDETHVRRFCQAISQWKNNVRLRS